VFLTGPSVNFGELERINYLEDRNKGKTAPNWLQKDSNFDSSPLGAVARMFGRKVAHYIGKKCESPKPQIQPVD
jgi:hypothetical protein